LCHNLFDLENSRLEAFALSTILDLENVTGSEPAVGDKYSAPDAHL